MLGLLVFQFDTLHAEEMPMFHIHRGFLDGGRYIENTLDAFRAAKIAGQTMIELDVRFSKDHRVVVYHDLDLLRLSHNTAKVAELTSTELKAFQVPTLYEVLSDPRCPPWVSIELKNSEHEDLGFEREVVGVIHRAQAERRVIVTSFNESALGRIAQIAPTLRRVYLTARNSQTESDEQFITRIQSPLNEAKTNWLSLYYVPITSSLAQALHDHGLEFIVWTINDQENATKQIQFGAKGVVTDSVMLHRP